MIESFTAQQNKTLYAGDIYGRLENSNLTLQCRIKYVNVCARDLKIDFEINSKQIDKLIKKENKWRHEIFRTKLTK